MKKVFVLLIASVVLLGCKQQRERAALSAYEAQMSQLEELYEDETLDEGAIDAALAGAMEAMLGLAESSPSVALRLFEDKMVAYMTIEQKGRLFAVVNLDTLVAHGFDKSYSRYEAELKTQAGSPMIDIVCGTAGGDTLRLSEVLSEHDYVLLDFWASWCRPCRELMPKLKSLYEESSEVRSQMSDKRLGIVSVSIDKDLDAWKGMIAKLELPWLHGAAELSRPGTAPAEEYGVSYIPTLFLIGHDGTIIAREPKMDFIRERIKSVNN